MSCHVAGQTHSDQEPSSGQGPCKGPPAPATPLGPIKLPGLAGKHEPEDEQHEDAKDGDLHNKSNSQDLVGGLQSLSLLGSGLVLGTQLRDQEENGDALNAERQGV